MKHFIRLIRHILPNSLLQSVRPLTNFVRSKVRIIKRVGMKKLTLESLKSDLVSAGIASGDTIMVHSSLASIGNVSDGPSTIIKSLLAAVTSDGTVMMPTYSSAEDVQGGMTEDRFVDLRTQRSSMGKITETFRSWPNIVRSSHPFSSVVALGKQAEYMTATHATNPNICHSESPMGLIVENNAKIIGIGISIAVGMAVSHFLEDDNNDFPIEVHSPAFPVKYIDNNGTTIDRDIIRFDPVVSLTRIGSPNTDWICDALTKHFTKLGLMRHFRFGNADSWVMDAQPVFIELKQLAKKGITIYLTKDQWGDMNAGDMSIDSWSS